MKSVRFKSKKINIIEKIFITVLLSIIISILITSYITRKMTTNIMNIADKAIKKENMLILKDAFSKRSFEDMEINDLIKVVKNSNAEIVEVDFNIVECEKILQEIVHYIDQETWKLNKDGKLIYIPLGYLTNAPLLINLGPKIPINSKLTDIALGNIKTSIREYGINNALVEIYLEITLNVDTILPLEKRNQSITYGSLIASKIITGKVPNFYNGTINKKSEQINLPINQ